MALLDLSMQDKRHARTEASRAEELTKGAINWCLSSQTEVRWMARHSEPSDLRGAAEAAQPDVAVDREQVAPGSAH